MLKKKKKSENKLIYRRYVHTQYVCDGLENKWGDVIIFREFHINETVIAVGDRHAVVIRGAPMIFKYQ